MNTKNTYPAILLLLGLLLVSACSPIIPNTGAEPDLAASATQASVIAQAVEATSTTMAMQTQISQLQTQVAQPQATETEVLPTVVPPTAEPTATATATMLPPTATPVPPTPTVTPIPLPCNAAQFVEDFSVADGTEIVAGTSFTKTWRLRNTGACTWTTAYDLAFFDGDRMGAARITPLPFNVAPGQTIDVTIELVAPDAEGRYRGYWVLQTPFGEPFGTGRNNEAFYVDIRVIQPESHNPLDLAANYCMAEWSSGAGRLPCQGQSGDARGSVRRIENPILETGYNDDEPVLLTQPQAVNDGIIRGKYPTMRIEKGWHFVSVIGCAYNASDCDVHFQLDYQIDGGSIKNLASWHEVYDESFQLVDVDLSSLAGKDVNLILTVFANGSSHQDQAQWLAPHISTSVQWQTPK